MPRYLNGINLSSVMLGEDTGKQLLSTAVHNTLLGARAGSGLTSGSGNTILGSYTAETEGDLTGSVILSNGEGVVACRWNASGTPFQPLIALPATVAAQADGTVALYHDPSTNALAWRLRSGGSTYTSYSANLESINALGINAALLGGLPSSDYMLTANSQLLTTAGGTSLIRDAPTLKLRSLTQGMGIQFDAATNPDVIQVSSTVSIADATRVLADGPAHSLLSLTTDAPAFRLKQIQGADGISLDDSTDNTIIIRTAMISGSDVNLAHAGSVDSQSLVSVGQGPSLALRGLRLSGPGLTLNVSPDERDVVLSCDLQAGGGVNDAPLLITGPTSKTVQGLSAGDNVLLVPGTGVVTIHTPTVVVLRPPHVLATAEQLSVTTRGAAWTIPANVLPSDLLTAASAFPMPSICYGATSALSHSGYVVFEVPNLPVTTNPVRGYTLSATVQSALTGNNFTFSCQATVLREDGTAQQHSGILTISGTSLNQPYEASINLTAAAGSDAVMVPGQASACPKWPRRLSTDLLILKLFNTTSLLAADVHIQAVRLTLLPASS